MCRGLLPSLALSLLALLGGGCDLFLESPPDPQVAVVSSEGVVRVLQIDDGLIEVAWAADVSPGSVATVRRAGESLLVASGTGLSQFKTADGESQWPRVELPSDILNLAYSGTDRVFTIGFNEVVGFDLGSGGPLWSRSLLDDLLSVSDRAIAASPNGLALGGDPTRVLDTESGIVLAESAGGGSGVSAVTLEGEFLLVGDDQGMQALDSDSLDVVWVSEVGIPVDRFVVGAGGLLVSSLGAGLVLLDPANGDVLASAQAGEVFREVVAQGDLFFAARSDGTLLAFDADLSEVWRAVRDVDFGGLSVSRGSVYYAQGSGVEALNTATGDSMWTRDFDGSMVGLLGL